MNKALITFIISLFFGINASAQNYLKYHDSINEAETLWANENFQEAVLKYKETFNEYEYAFTKDYIIAAQIAAINNDYAHCYEFINAALEQGYLCECIEKLPAFETLIQQETWSRTKAQQNEILKTYYNNINQDLAIEFSKRYRDEQDHKGTSTYPDIVKANYQRIKSLIEEKGFPSEQLLGLDNSKIAPNKRNKNSGLEDCEAANAKIIVTLLHYDNPITDIGMQTFMGAIQDGLLPPRAFAYIYTFERYEVSRINDSQLKNPVDLPLYEFNFPFGVKHENTDLVNQHRAIFSITSLEVDAQKEATAKKHKIKYSFGYQ